MVPGDSTTDCVKNVELHPAPAEKAKAFNRTQNRLLRESTWVVGGRVLGIGTAFGINVVLARILSPADVGVFFLLASILTFSGFVAMFGLNTVLVRFVSESIGLRDALGARVLLRRGGAIAMLSLTLGGLLCLVFLIFFGESLFRIPNISTIAPLVALSVVASSTLQLVGSLLRSFHDSRLSILLTGQFGGPISNLLFIAATVGLYFFVSPTLEQVILFSTVSMCVLVPLAIYALYRISKSRLAEIDAVSPSTNAVVPVAMIAACIPMMLTQSLSYVTGQADIWIAGSYVNHDELALYGAARRIMLLIGMPMQLVNLTVIAAIAELRVQGRLKDLQKILRSAATLAAIPALVAWIPILLFPAQISALVFGSYYAESALALQILSVGQIVFVCVGAAELTLMMSGHHKKALLVNVVTSLAFFAAGPLMVQQWGIVGLAVTWTAIVSIQCISFLLCARLSVGVWTGMDARDLSKLRDMLLGFIKNNSKRTTEAS